jgi:uncharacterized protein (UPF0332 family)
MLPCTKSLDRILIALGARPAAENWRMPKILPRKRFLRVSMAASDTIKSWKEGISLAQDSGQTLDKLMAKVAADRLAFAYSQYAHARKLMKSTPGLYRSAISRYYYAMYHAVRACVFISNSGDEYEAHSILPSHIPPNFDPTGRDWQGVLKSARFDRNRADYEPYPKNNGAWRKTAMALQSDAADLLKVARLYLRGKGCAL